MSLVDVLKDILLNSREQEHGHQNRPQGPGLNIGEVGIRRKYGMPTSAHRTKYGTTSGLGSAPYKKAPKPVPSRQEYVNKHYNKWVASHQPDDDFSLGDLFKPATIHDEWHPRESQAEAFKDEWGKEWDHRYGGVDRSLAQKGLGMSFGQDLDDDHVDKSNLALSLAMIFGGGPALKGGTTFAKNSGGKAAGTVMKTVRGAADEFRASRPQDASRGLPINAPLSGRGLRSLGSSPYEAQGARNRFQNAVNADSRWGDQLSWEDFLPVGWR